MSIALALVFSVVAGFSFEQDHRVNRLTLEFATDSFATNNAFGHAVAGSLVREQVQSLIDAKVNSGAMSVLFTMPGLVDLRGSGEASLQIGVVNGAPVIFPNNPAFYSGASDLDWWYTLNGDELDAGGLPILPISGSISGGLLRAGPGRLTLAATPFGDSGQLRMSSVLMTAGIGSSSAPLQSINTFPPGHLTVEQVDPALQSFASMHSGQLKGNVSAVSLANTPIPDALIGGQQEYTAANSLLDVLVTGWSHFFVGTQISATQPDASDPDLPAAGSGPPYRLIADTATKKVIACQDRLGNPVSLADGLNAAAYSVYFTFTTDRVIVRPGPHWVSGAPCSGVVFETFNVNNQLGIDDLIANQGNFPNNPRERTLIGGFDSRLAYADDSHEDYAGRLSGLFFPPVSGNWIFHMRSDDSGRLYLNPNGAFAAGKVQVADEPGCCNAFMPVGSAQTSIPYPLQAGQAYYVELLWRESGGGDYGQVAVSLQGSPTPTTANLAGSLVGAGAAPAGIGGPVTITQQPVSQTVFENSFVTFTAQAENPNGLPICYQWTVNGQDIPGATLASYTWGPVSLAGNGDVFAVRVGVIGTSGASDPARLTVLPDTTPPTLVSATGSSTDLLKVVLTFSELIDYDNATDPANYTLSGAAKITSARLEADGKTVTLQLDRRLPPATTDHLLTVEEISDLSLNVMEPVTIPVRTLELCQGLVRTELYRAIPGTAVTDLRNSEKYPTSPDLVRFRGSLELNTVDEFDGYGARMVGYLTPPVSGNYYFFMSSDDGGAFYLSDDIDPANLALVASEPQWNGRRDWLGTARRNASAPENRSSTLFPGGILLTAGEIYYFEALMKEGYGADHLSVAWQMPGDPLPAHGSAPIPGIYLSSLVDPTVASLAITQQPVGQTNIIPAGQLASATTFTVSISAAGPYSENVFYQWFRDGGSGFQPVPGANGANYTFTPSLADHGSKYRVEVLVPGAKAVSEAAILTVAQPNTPPRFASGADQNVSAGVGPQSVPWATHINPDSITRTPVMYANDFTGGADAMQLAGIASVSDAALKLTTPLPSAYGAASISTPDVYTYQTLTVSWKSLIGGGANGGADGYSLNIGEDVPVDPGYGNEGYRAEEGVGSGLRVAVDTFNDGGGDGEGIDIKWRGSQVAFKHIPKDDDGTGVYLRKNVFVDATLDVSASGQATFTYDSSTITAQLPGYAGIRANRALFWARSGTANDNHFVDDLSLTGLPYGSSLVEAGQAVHFLVTNDQPSLFSAQPAISPDGTLTYTPAPNASGTALVTVIAQDDGGTAYGGIDSSAAITFRINVASLLRIRLTDDGSAIVSWPSPSTGWMLQQATALSPQQADFTAWTDVTSPPVVVGSENTVTFSPPRTDVRFFRLRHP